MILSIIFSITITQRVHYMKVIQVSRRTVLNKIMFHVEHYKIVY